MANNQNLIITKTILLDLSVQISVSVLCNVLIKAQQNK